MKILLKNKYPRAPTKKKVMKEYKIWKFNKSGYLQTVTISLEEEYPCKQKDVDIPV